MRDIRNVDIWDSNASENLKAANAMWWWLRDFEGIGWVVAGKVLARLRPRLVPMYDTVIKQTLGVNGDYWIWMAQALGADLTESRELLDQAKNMRANLRMPQTYPLLRVIDAAAWMLGSSSTRVQNLRLESAAVDPIQQDFGHQYRSFRRTMK